MASIVTQLSPPLFFNATQLSHPTCLPILSLPSTKLRKGSFSIVTKTTSESSESSSSLSIVESVRSVWNKSENRLAVIGFGFAAVVAIWTSSKIVTAIDKLPIFPSTFEFIGILYSSWFTYRYLLFRPDREELLRNINKSVSEVLGQ